MARVLKADRSCHSLEDAIQYLSSQMKKRPKLCVLIGSKCKSTEPDHVYLRQIQKEAEKYGVDLAVLEKNVLSPQESLFAAATKAQVIESPDGAMVLSNFPSLKSFPWVSRCDLDRSWALLGEDVLNLSRANYPRFSCTADAVHQILKHNGVPLAGKKVGVVGRSAKVGLSTALLLMQANATVTIYHSFSDLQGLKNEDIVVSAIGKPKLLTADFFCEGQTVIDVGINTDPTTGKICGDVDFDNVVKVLGDKGAITPVPGGVGPLTNTILFSRLFFNAWNNQKAEERWGTRPTE